MLAICSPGRRGHHSGALLGELSRDGEARGRGAEGRSSPTTRPASGSRPAQLEAAITPADQARSSSIRPPTRPGAVYPRAELEAIVDVAVRHNLYVLSDEIYEYLVYDGVAHDVPGDPRPRRPRRGRSSSPASRKTYSMTGWRLGTLVAPPPIAKAGAELQSQMTSNATTFAQYGALAALQEKEKTRAALRADADGVRPAPEVSPRALSTRFPASPACWRRGPSTCSPTSPSFGLSSQEFCARLLEKEKVAAVPGQRPSAPRATCASATPRATRSSPRASRGSRISAKPPQRLEAASLIPIRQSHPCPTKTSPARRAARSPSPAAGCSVPDHPVIPFIEGDGTGPDIWRASVRVFDAAVAKAYGGKRKIAWFEVFAGEKASSASTTGCPTTRSRRSASTWSASRARSRRRSAAASARSTSRCARCSTSTSACAPCAGSQGVPSPVKRPETVDMVIFRENTEDIYAGIEFAAGTPEAQKILDFIAKEFPKDFEKIRFGTKAEAEAFWNESAPRASRATSRWASASSRSATPAPSAWSTAPSSTRSRTKRKSVTIVHKGNIMKFTEGAFRDWGYEVAKEFFGAVEIDGGPWCKIPEGKPGAGIVIKDAIADITLQQVLTRPTEFDVIATLNLNGDYLSDALAAQVGGIGIAPGGNINYITGHAIFEATHGTAPKYAEQGQGQPGLGRPLGRDDAPLPGLERGRGPGHQGPERRDRREARHLRLRAPDGGRDRDQVLRVRRQHHRAHVIGRSAAGLHFLMKPRSQVNTRAPTTAKMRRPMKPMATMPSRPKQKPPRNGPDDPHDDVPTARRNRCPS